MPSPTREPPLLARRTALPRPGRGRSTRIHVGGLELILESARGADVLICNDGHEARRWSLGLPPDAELSVRLCAPAQPMHLALPDPIAVAPGGRLRGYVQVALVPTVEILRAGHAPEVLAEILPRQLAAEWDEAHGFLLRAESPFLLRTPVPTVHPRAVVPILLRNGGAQTVQVSEIPVLVTDDELVTVRGQWFAAARRLVWRDSGLQTEVRRPEPTRTEEVA